MTGGLRLTTWWAALYISAAVCVAQAQQNLLLRGGTILAMTGQEPFKADVLIRDGRIQQIGRTLALPSDTRVIDATNQYILPGFTDMHAHVTFLRTDAYSSYDRATSESVLRMLLAYGVTTVRNPAAPAVQSAQLRDDVAQHKILGPRIFTAGESLNGAPFSTDDEIRAEVDRQAATGVDYIKVYANSIPAQTAAAIDEAHKRGLKVIGHLQNTDWPTAADEGIDFVIHGVCWSSSALPPAKRQQYALEQKRVGSMKARIFWLESADVNGPQIAHVIRSLKEHGISDDPTLIAYKTKFVPEQEYRGRANVSLAPKEMQESWKDGGLTADWSSKDLARMQRVWPKLLQIVARYYKAGVMLTTGSDLPNTWVVPGASLHQEMELLAAAGIPNMAVLEMSTVNAAKALGIESEVGTVKVGKRADLVLLQANPLHDIRNTRLITFVLKEGLPYKPSDILSDRTGKQ